MHFRRRRRITTVEPDAGCCPTCSLNLCARGTRARVLGLDCELEDAQKLRALGLFEGAPLRVVDLQAACVLAVLGSKVAIAHQLAARIRVQRLEEAA